MDQIKIGRFIADERKRKEYTQKQLSERLGISDKTISKWERGNGFPEVSLLLPLCAALEITVNELLSGERVSEEEYRRKAEENMVNLVKEAQESKKKIILSAMVAGLTLIAAIPLFLLAGALALETWLRILRDCDRVHSGYRGRCICVPRMSPSVCTGYEVLSYGAAHDHQTKAGLSILRGAQVLQKGPDKVRGYTIRPMAPRLRRSAAPLCCGGRAARPEPRCAGRSSKCVRKNMIEVFAGFRVGKTLVQKGRVGIGLDASRDGVKAGLYMRE